MSNKRNPREYQCATCDGMCTKSYTATATVYDEPHGAKKKKKGCTSEVRDIICWWCDACQDYTVYGDDAVMILRAASSLKALKDAK